MDGFYLTHVGTICPSRNSALLWDVLRKLNIGLRLVGDIDHSVIETTKGLDLMIEGHVSHERAIQIMIEAPLLLLLINNCFIANTIIPGKIYEYIGARRPILGIGPPDSESGNMLRESASGVMVDFDDRKGMKEFILSCKNWME